MSLSSRLFNRIEPLPPGSGSNAATELVSGVGVVREIDYTLTGRPTQSSGVWPRDLYPDEQPQSGVNPDET